MWGQFAGEGVTTLALVTSCLSPAVYKACFVRGKECESHEFLSESFVEEEWSCLTQHPDPRVCVRVCARERVCMRVQALVRVCTCASASACVCVWPRLALRGAGLPAISKRVQGAPRTPDIGTPTQRARGHCVLVPTVTSFCGLTPAASLVTVRPPQTPHAK